MTVDEFLKKNNFKSCMITDELVSEMKNSLLLGENRDKGNVPDMFRTWTSLPKKLPCNSNIIVIDAGGTNFRSALVKFDSKGMASVCEFRKTFMPALERQYSRKEFFDAIADNIDYLKDKAERISFCFSYSMTITQDGDGIPTAFSKEIKASEVLGIPVGKTLLETLKNRGWKKIQKITLLNDTVAALLAGFSLNSEAKYSSYIGFILGTGINSALLYENHALGIKKQIIVCEIGKSHSVSKSTFDILADKKTETSGQYLLEKSCSGAYIGLVALEMLHLAAVEGLFSDSAKKKILCLEKLSAENISSLLSEKGEFAGFDRIFEKKSDKKILFELLESLVDRCAKIVASILASSLILCGEGKDKNHPVCILCNGTTFFKMHNLKTLVEKYLYEFATVKEKINYKIVSRDDDITVGTALAAFSSGAY